VDSVLQVNHKQLMQISCTTTRYTQLKSFETNNFTQTETT